MTYGFSKPVSLTYDKAIEKVTEEQIGLLLPCNIIVYEKEGKTIVGAFDPMSMMKLVENETLKSIAEDVAARLHRVLNSLS